MARSRSKFEPVEAGGEAAQPKQVERYSRAQISGTDDAAKNQFLKLIEYMSLQDRVSFSLSIEPYTSQKPT